MRAAWLLLFVACGRFGFDARGDAAASGGDVPGLDTIVTSGLIAYYPFDDPAALNLYVDASGHNHPAYNPDSFACPTIIAGHTGTAARFDAMGNELYVQSTAELETTAGYTVATWLRVDAAPPTYMCALNKPLTNSTTDSWQLCVTDTLQLYFGIGGSTGDVFTPNGSVTVGAWHHAAITWDTQTTAIWLDGALASSTAAPTDMFDGSLIMIGYDHDPAGDIDGYQGVLDDVRIYDHALSAAELAQLAGS